MKTFTIDQRLKKLKMKLNSLPESKFNKKYKRTKKVKRAVSTTPLSIMDQLKIHQNNMCAECSVRLRKTTRIIYNETLICIKCARKIIGGL